MADSKGYDREAGLEGIGLPAGGSASTGVEADLVCANAWAGLSAPVIAATAILQGRAPEDRRGDLPFCIVSRAGDPSRHRVGAEGSAYSPEHPLGGRD